MVAISLAMIACLSWGFSSFLAGTKSRVLPVLTLLFLPGIVCMAMLIFCVAFRGVAFPADPKLLYAVLAGTAALFGLYCLYRGLAVGAISVVVPISALCVIIPVLTGFAMGEVLNSMQIVGIVIAVAGGLSVCIEKKTDVHRKRLVAGIIPALGAALGFGSFCVAMDPAGAVDPLWAAMISRASFSLFLLLAVMLKRPPLKIKFAHLPAVVAIGVLEGSGLFFFTVATTQGMLGVVSVISSLYPAVAVILAAIFLKEKLTGTQIIGVLMTLLGIVCIVYTSANNII